VIFWSCSAVSELNLSAPLHYYKCFSKLVVNKRPKNKGHVTAFIAKYRIKCWNCSSCGHTSWLHNRSIIQVYSTGSLYRFSPRVLSTGSLFGLFFGLFLGTTVLIILSIYIRPVDPQVDYYWAIQSILCCAYITTIIVIFIIKQVQAFVYYLATNGIVKQGHKLIINTLAKLMNSKLSN
jgi:hypothetical protein